MDDVSEKVSAIFIRLIIARELSFSPVKFSFFFNCSSPKIKNPTFRKPIPLPSSGKEVPDLLDPLDRVLLNNWVKAP